MVKRIIKEEDLAQEVLQDAFLKIWEKIDQYQPDKGRLFTWMLNLTRNLAIDKTRSKEFNKSKKTDSINIVVGSNSREPIEESYTDGIGVKNLLNELNQDQQFIVEQLYFKGYTQQEVADEFGIPLGTVKTRLRQAMVLLRKTLGVQ